MATQDQLDAFTGITGADAEAAAFFLTAANGDIEVRSISLSATPN